ncbi:histidine phosphatase family protein [Brevibacillus dissolubilis]|uniref:histidine phosphatase family protein n=1 Tax=Brevibacillus dissolubilis TaxID=1844116 RepID=UPI00159BCA07|nr:histidine phosphatase family protein [Brevibacillus dissolubilis]
MFYKKTSVLACLLTTFVFFFSGSTASAVPLADGNDTASLLEAMKQGGYILYMRHGEATVGEDDPTHVDLTNCKTQRNLSEKGKTQARQIGEVFKKHAIPIQYPVLASPYCRARETANLAFEMKGVVTHPLLSLEKLEENLGTFLKTAPEPGKNRIIIAHGTERVAAFDYLDVIVIKPDPQGNDYQTLGKISREEFIKWANQNQPQ